MVLRCGMAARMFDLNVEKVLEHWTVAHAVREVIANALDEQALTGGPDPTITKDEQGRWHIRDQGRGLRYQHLTQNENQEKLERPQLVIGKFGVGLKDALATFHRHKIGISIRSVYGTITVEQAHKHGFEDITTLHALVDDTAVDPAMRGTDVALDGVSDDDIETAKGFFLRYSGDSVLEQTPVGEVLQRGT